MLRRTLLVVVMTSVTALGGVAANAGVGVRDCGAGAHGSAGYAYAGHQAVAAAHGVRATITPLVRPAVAAGHVAGWVGVGGPGQGRNGETVWLQAGIASLPGTPAMVYVEITRPGKGPELVPVREGVEVGESHRIAVLELAGRPNVWQVWVDGAAVTKPLYLPGSTGRWRPIATAESWDGGTATCNDFSFRFDGVAVASRVGGGWRSFVPGFEFLDRGYAVKALAPASAPRRALAADGVARYAFEASSH